MASAGFSAVQPGGNSSGTHERVGDVEMAVGVWEPGQRSETLKAFFEQYEPELGKVPSGLGTLGRARAKSDGLN